METLKEADTYAMVGYQLKNTLTENGTVSRGICRVQDGFLANVTEYTAIEEKNGFPGFTNTDGQWVNLPVNTVVSLNLWGFAPSFFSELKGAFERFLKEELPANPLKGEFYLPFAVNTLLQTRKARAVVLSSEEKWYGVTYKEDKPTVQKALLEMICEGKYPERIGA